ncbi:MAG TPA: metal-dependent transcriptional regulator [Chitinophagaceae bacterium]|jgi:DtxR family Mn-dependent transcriptional regulator|nr:metal-dependent transcriptional regulator [Chitinophagaceae bacterium]
MLNFSTSEENYLKTIFHLQTKEDNVSTNELAEKLQAKPASITDMMKKLKTRKLVNYQPYQGFRLTPDGKKVALSIIRRHRLWEYFLAEKLKFNWDEVHEIAEQMEHVSSKKLIDKLDEYLGYPKFDPHGDPIPDTNGKMETGKQVNLSDLPVDKPAKVCFIANQTELLMEHLNEKKMNIGVSIVVKRKFSYDDSLEIKLDNKVLTISDQLAKNIFVRHG